MTAVSSPASTPRAGASVSENLANTVAQLVLKRVRENTLALPAPPTAVTRCLEITSHSEFSFQKLVPIVETDPMLAARIFRAANSAATYGTKITTLLSALTRIGAKRIRTVLVEASAERLFQSRDQSIQRMVSRVWTHSVAVALISRDLAALTARNDPDEACMAGLLHDVGKPIVAAILLEAERQFVEFRGKAWVDSSVWVDVMGRVHREIGVAVAEHWGIPDAVAQTIRDSSEFDPGNRNALANLVCFANALAKGAGLGVDDSKESVDDANALVMIGRSMLGIEEQLANTVATNVKTRAAEGNLITT